MMNYVTTKEAAQLLNVTDREFLGLTAFGAISVHEVYAEEKLTKYVSRQEIETRNPYALEIILGKIREAIKSNSMVLKGGGE